MKIIYAIYSWKTETKDVTFSATRIMQKSRILGATTRIIISVSAANGLQNV